jgi:hypothetical protein
MCTNNTTLSSAKPVCLLADNAVFIFTRYAFTAAVWYISTRPREKRYTQHQTPMLQVTNPETSTRNHDYAIFGTRLQSLGERNSLPPIAMLHTNTALFYRKSMSHTFVVPASKASRPQNNLRMRNHKISHSNHGDSAQGRSITIHSRCGKFTMTSRTLEINRKNTDYTNLKSMIFTSNI